MTKGIAGESADVGSQIGVLLADRYRIDAVIGRGGMATVYRATDEALGRTVALKVFRSDLADADDVRRQHEEIRLIAGLNHFALVTLFDAVADDSAGEHGRAFIVMQFVDGPDLRRRLDADPLDPRTTAMVGADLAEALAYVHDRGVVHRDVKPANILLPARENETTGPQAMLADFGIARIVDGTRLTATGSVLGSANYLSPEQAVGSALSPATDVYSLGLVLIECLSGQKSFPGSAIESVSARLARDPEVPEQFGPAWTELLRSMTAREPSARPSASVTAATLREIALGQQPTGESEDAAESLDPTLRYPSSDFETTTAFDRASGVTQSDTARIAPPSRESRARDDAQTDGAQTDNARPDAARPGGTWRGWGRRRIAVTAAIATLAVAAVIGIWSASTSATNAPHVPGVEYPAVSGDLGTHLKQLERSVAP